MFRIDDLIEATEDLRTDDGPVFAGQQMVVQEVSASGAWVRGFGFNSFIRASAFKKIAHLT